MRANEFLIERATDVQNPGRKEIDPDVYEDLANSIIARIARQIVPTIRAKSTPEGYVYLSTQDGLSLVIGCNIAGGSIDINIGSQPMETTSSGPHKGAVTKIISAVYQAAVKRYGEPTEQGTLSIDHDAGHGVWQHIAQKLGLQYDAHMVKENLAEEFTNYQGLRPPKNVFGTNLFSGQDIVGQRVYHCTNRLEAIKKSGGLKPRRDATGEREYGRLSTDEHPFIPVIGIWFSVGKPDWPGKHCVSFVIEPTDQVYVAYASIKGLKPNVVLNPIALDRLTIEGQQDVKENFADGKNPVKFTVTTPDGYTHSFQITLTVHGKHVGHFNFVRGADTDDVNNEAEVESRWQGQGYGKLLLMKAIDVANNHGLDFQQDIRGITDAQQNVYDSLENAGSIVTPGDGFWFLTPQGEQELNGLNENFADGRNPQDKGDAKRHGVPTKASVSTLRKVAKQGGRKGQLAHWLANMKAGRAKKNKTNEDTVATINLGGIIVNMDDHALDRQQQRGISNKSFNSAIRKLKLPRVINQMSQLEVGNRFYVLDHITNVALGMRKIGNAKYVLKTVLVGRPADYNIADIITV